MRIKNLTSYTSNQTIFSIVVMFLLFTAIDILILAIALRSGMTLGESFSWMFSSFCEADLEMKFAYLFLLISPFIWLFCLVSELEEILIMRYINAYKSKTFIKYIDFYDDKIKLSYPKSNSAKEIYYKDIDSIELVIDCAEYHGRALVRCLYINIKSGSYFFSIHHEPFNFNKFFKVIYYSQYMNNFSCRFTGKGEHAKEILQKKIDDYIKNGYKKTLRTYLYSSVNPVIVLIIFVSIMAGWILFIYSLFK